MDSHDQALQWAEQNPDDPRAKTIQAKAWAAKNPDDPRSAQILQKLQQSQDPKANPFQTANTIDSKLTQAKIGDDLAAQVPDVIKQGVGMASAFLGGRLKGFTLGNAEAPGTKEAMQAHPVAGGVGSAIGSVESGEALGGLAGQVPTSWGFLGRMARAAGQGGATGLLQKPGEGETRLGNAGQGAGMGALVQGGLEGVSSLAKGVKGALGTINPGQPEENAAKLAKALGDNTVSYKGEEMPATDVNAIRKKLSSEGIIGGPEYAAARSALAQNPGVDAELRDQTANFGTNKTLRSSLQGIMNGEHPISNAIQVGAAPLAGATRGAVRSLVGNNTNLVTQPETLQSILNLIEANKSEK